MNPTTAFLQPYIVYLLSSVESQQSSEWEQTVCSIPLMCARGPRNKDIPCESKNLNESRLPAQLTPPPPACHSVFVVYQVQATISALANTPQDKLQGSTVVTFISQKVLIKSFWKSQVLHISVNLSFIITNIKNKLTNVCGN